MGAAPTSAGLQTRAYRSAAVLLDDRRYPATAIVTRRLQDNEGNSPGVVIWPRVSRLVTIGRYLRWRRAGGHGVAGVTRAVGRLAVPEPGAIAALASTCLRVVDTLPAAEVAEARDRARAALAELAEIGASRDADLLAATGGLTALLADLSVAAADLAAAADRVRAFRGRLG